MLVLSRKTEQSIMIGDDIEIVVSSIDGNSVRIGIKAPKDLKILRKETFEEVRQENIKAVQAASNYNQDISQILPRKPESDREQQGEKDKLD
ncbi:MAG: carbon storage regulator CsrA [Bacillota bacterium]